MNGDLLRSEIEASGRTARVVEDVDAVTFLLFGLGQRAYATAVTFVREIVDLTEVQQIPNAPHDVLGMIDLRNQSIPVVDLAARMQVASDPQSEARIIVFEFEPDGKQFLLGVVADRVIGVREVSEHMIETLGQGMTGWRGEGVRGVIRADSTQYLVLEIEHYLQVNSLPGEFEFD